MYLLVRRTIWLVSFALFAGNAHAITLDWDAQTWANGSLSNSLETDPANAGTDVTTTISGNTAQLGIESTGQQTPALTTNLQGGLATAERTLTLYIDLTSQTQSITVNVSFSSNYTQGVTNVSFSLFDVDQADVSGAGGAHFQDEIRSVIGIAPDGSQVAATITTSASNVLTGTGLNQVVDGISTATDLNAGSGAGNVYISFGTTAISSFRFVYGSGTGGNAADPTAQHIGLHDVSFTPVPEVNPAIAAAFSCLVAMLLIRYHHARLRK